MEYSVSDTTKKLHSCQLLLALELKRLCEKHNIKFFMIAGTLLGAVRHKGFIPWDDDMDFAIMRSDYGRFLEICKTELGDDFILQDMSTDPNYGLPMAKLLLKGTRLVERTTAKNKAIKGIYIDVFPYDNIPDLPEQRKKHEKKLYFLKRLFLAKQGYRIAEKGETFKQLIYKALKLISLFLSSRTIRSALDKEMKKYELENTERVAAIGGAYQYSKEAVKKEWFSETVLLPFEEITLPAPICFDEYLTHFYGDYMTPPPVDKRENRHGVVELDFGKYNS